MKILKIETVNDRKICHVQHDIQKIKDAIQRDREKHEEDELRISMVDWIAWRQSHPQFNIILEEPNG